MREIAAEALLREFGVEAHERLGRVEGMLLELPDVPLEFFDERLDQIRRDLHTLKGNSALVGLGELQALAHEMEDLADELAPGRVRITPLLAEVDRFRRVLVAAEAQARRGVHATHGAHAFHGAQPAQGGRADGGAAAGEPLEGLGAASGDAAAGASADTGAGAAAAELAAAGAAVSGRTPDTEAASARIPFGAIDGLIELLAEVVMFRNRLTDGLGRLQAEPTAWEQVQRAHQGLGATLDLLQEGVLRLRMVPLRTLFGQLHRLVYDEREQQGKAVQLVTEGGDTPLDKGLLELASEVLGHLVRNAVTHGIEPPAERLRLGKPEQGSLRLSAFATAREVRIDVEDDGRGLDTAAIGAAAARLRVPGAATADPAQLVFLPGLTTRASADLSGGRGIGLAAVRAAVVRRGGRIELVSEEGAGSLFRLTLPLSASITRALLLRCDTELYALPLRAVVEGLRFRAGELHEVNGAGILRWHGKILPALDLGCSFGTAAERRAAGYAVVIEEGPRQRALLVDEIQGARDVVVKGLDPVLGTGGGGLGGSTVLGDGRAVLLLDPLGLLDLPLATQVPS
jgi:two-component system, chemotaxis family, sensor kinase CheA